MLKRFERLRLPTIRDGVISDDLSGMEFEYSSIDGVNPFTIPDITKATVLGFNQGKYKDTISACTIVNSTRALLKTANGVRGYQATIKDIFDVVTLAVTDMAYVVGKGWYAFKGVDAARKRWNATHPDKTINSFLIGYNDPDFQTIMDKGYMMVGTYNGNTAYNNDFRSDAILNGTSFGVRTYGHCTPREKRNGEEYVNDSYDGNWYNIYKLLFPKKIIETGVWSNNFFFFIPAVDNSVEIKRLTSLRKETNDAITANSNSWHLEKDTKYQKELNSMNNTLRKKLELIESQLKVL